MKLSKSEVREYLLEFRSLPDKVRYHLEQAALSAVALYDGRPGRCCGSKERDYALALETMAYYQRFGKSTKLHPENAKKP